jgi:outer membrane receptor protein involved in Fe transport
MIKSKVAGMCVAIAAFGLLPQGTVYPEVEDKEQSSEFVLDELSLGDIFSLKISTGSFLELDLSKSPLSMTIIDKEMVKTSGARNISELLEIYVPGFIYNFNKWFGTVWAMRGVSDDRNTKIIYLVNGHKMNNQTRDGFTSETVLGLLGDIERVEVLRGPAGLVYGTGAIAGIINVVTQKANDNGSASTIAAGTDGSRSFEGTFHATPSENQQLSISAGFKKSDGLSYDKVRLYGKSGWPYTPGWTNGAPGDGRFGSTEGNWKLSGDWTWDRFNLYVRATHQIENCAALFILDPFPEVLGPPPAGTSNRIIDGKSVEYNDPYWSGTESERKSRKSYISDAVMAEAQYNLPVRNDNNLEFTLSYDRTTSRIVEELLSKYQPDYLTANGLIFETFGDTRYMARTMFLLKSIQNLQTAFGIEYRLDDLGPDMNGRNEYNGNPKHYVIKDIVYHTFTNFAEGFYDINDHWGTHLGYRLDLHTRATMFNPKAAVIYRPNQDHSIKLIYQSASNNGTVDNYEYNRNQVGDDGTVNKEPVAQSTTVKPFKDNTLIQPALSEELMHDLKPDKVHTLELSYVGKLTDNISCEPSFTYGIVKNLFGWSQKVFRVVNVERYQYINADIDLKYTSSKFKFGVNHTFQRPVGTDPDDKKFTKTFILFEPRQDSVTGEWGYFAGYNPDGDSVYVGYYSQTKQIDINLLKDQITYDGKNFLNIPTNMTKLYLTYSQFEWISLSGNLRLFWGLPGREKLIRDQNDNSNYVGYYQEKDNSSFKNYFMHSVSKKLNLSLNVYLPKDFDVSIFGYNILASDNHIDGKFDYNTVNTLRAQHTYDSEQTTLYSTDQRSFGVSITKKF